MSNDLKTAMEEEIRTWRDRVGKCIREKDHSTTDVASVAVVRGMAGSGPAMSRPEVSPVAFKYTLRAASCKREMLIISILECITSGCILWLTRPYLAKTTGL